MGENHFSNRISQLLDIDLTDEQYELIHKLEDFVLDKNDDSVFLLRGYAGTGKTTVMGAFSSILKEEGYKIVLLAPTGRASKVLASYAHNKAYTIHRKIYKQCMDGYFELNENKSIRTLFIVDEASMISTNHSSNSIFSTSNLLDDLFKYVYNGRGCKLILIGDIAQLPPVGEVLSPALSTKELSLYKEVVSVDLKTVVRHNEQSDILKNATLLRNLMPKYRDKVLEGFFQLNIQGSHQVIEVDGNDVIDELSSCYDRYGMESTILITSSNKRANLFNEGIRGRVLYHDELLCKGDRLMIVKNNYHFICPKEGLDFIANGDIAEVVAIKGYEEIYNHQFANVTLLFEDYNNLELDCKILLDTLTLETPSLSAEVTEALTATVSEDYADILNPNARWAKIKQDNYINALQVKFSYAITCHKAQGGQWDVVFLDHGYLTDEMINLGFLRWLYTAFTRATKKIYLLNFDKHFTDEFYQA